MFNSEGITASEFISDRMQTFARFATSHKFGSYVDGLKPIHRRILWRMKDHDNFRKISTIAGDVMVLHPHGDGAIADSIFRMAQPFNNVFPLLDGVGNIGKYYRASHGAPRYVEANLSDFARDLFFRNTNRTTIPMTPSEVGDIPFEPKFLIPVIPTTLMMGTTGIGIGFRCNVIPMGFKDTCDAAEYFVELMASNKDPNKHLKKFAKYFMPDFPVDTYLLNYNELLQAYGKGDFNAAILTEGIMDVTGNSISIHSLPPDKYFSQMVTRLGKMVVGKDNFISENFSAAIDLSTGDGSGDFKLTLRRNVDPFDILDMLKKQAGFQSYWWPKPNFSTENDTLAVGMTPIQLMQVWYTERFRSVRADLKHRQRERIVDLRKNEAKLAIRGHELEVAEIFSKAEDVSDVIEPLSVKYGLTEFQVKYLYDFRYSELTKKGVSELEAESAKIHDDIHRLTEQMHNVPGLIVDKIESFRKKYESQSKRRTKIPSYKGAIVLKNGVMQCEDIVSLHRKLSTFEDATFMYMDDSKYRYSCRDNRVICLNDSLCDLPREVVTDRLILASHPLNHTVCMKDSMIYRLEGLHYRKIDGLDLTYVGDVCTLISKNGTVVQQPVVGLSLRKGIDTSGPKTDIIHVSATIGDVLYVVHVNDREPNVVRIDKIEKAGKLNKVPLGKTVILGVYTPEDSVAFTVPKEILNRCSVRHFYFKNIEDMFASSRSMRLFLSKKKTSVNKRLVPFMKSVIWTIES